MPEVLIGAVTAGPAVKPGWTGGAKETVPGKPEPAVNPCWAGAVPKFVAPRLTVPAAVGAKEEAGVAKVLASTLGDHETADSDTGAPAEAPAAEALGAVP